MAHRYYVEWSAPISSNSGETVVLANRKRDAINAAKRKLGTRVKRERLYNFVAWRVSTKSMRRHDSVVKTCPQLLTRHAWYVKAPK